MVKIMSIWNINEKPRQVEKLTKDIETDILIVGAGMTGLTTTYYLKDHPSICVVDSRLYGHGVTLNTTAKITYLQQDIYNKISSLVGEKETSIYLKSQKEAINYLKNIITKEKIDCDLKEVPSYLFATTEDDINQLEKEVSFLKNNGVNINKSKLPDKITSYLTYSVNDTYTFHPLKYLEGIYQILKKKKIPIYENTTILEIKKIDDTYYCYTEQNYIKAKKVILACHYPNFLKPFFIPFKSSIEKSYIVISKVEHDLNYACINMSNPTYSCRFYQEGDDIYQISLAESHNIAIKHNDLEHFNRVKEIFNLDAKNIVTSYSNIDIITKDYLPYIGELKENLFLATGYNTWGMTNSILASKILSDLIIEKKNEYAELFRPNRHLLITLLKLPFYLVSQVKSFFGPKINKEKEWYPNSITFEKRDGKNVIIYRDEQGKNHIVYNKCPHVGCSLIFNEPEKTWDCPCHSSRFDIDGNCIKGPSDFSIAYHEDE